MSELYFLQSFYQKQGEKAFKWDNAELIAVFHQRRSRNGMESASSWSMDIEFNSWSIEMTQPESSTEGTSTIANCRGFLEAV